MKINIKNVFITFVLTFSFLWSVGYAYTRFYHEKDYFIAQHVSCDPETENCFVWECDPTIEECSTNPEENVDYYKTINKHAGAIESCETPDTCEEPTCDLLEGNCEVIHCTDELAEEEGVVCSESMEAAEDEMEVEGEAVPTEGEEGASEQVFES